MFAYFFYFGELDGLSLYLVSIAANIGLIEATHKETI